MRCYNVNKTSIRSNDFVYITLKLPRGAAEWLEKCAKANAMEPSQLAAYIFETYKTIWDIAKRVTVDELTKSSKKEETENYEELLKRYIESKRTTEISEKYVRKITNTIRNFLTWCINEGVDPKSVEAIDKYLSSKKCSEKTKQIYRSHLKSFHSFLSSLH